MAIDKTLFRQWAMLRMIPRHPRRVSATDLTARLNELGYAVNKRTVERDLTMFEAMFGLVADDRSRPYGWYWSTDNPSLDIPSLDDGQALMLSVAEPFIRQLLPPPVLDALSPALGSAKRKLNESFGAAHLKTWPDKIYSASPSQALLPASIVPGAQEIVGVALLRDQWLRIQYRKRGATASGVFDVQPLGLVTRGSMTYLVCCFRGYREPRTIALSRLEAVEILSETFVRPPDFSLKAHVEEGKVAFGASRVATVVLRVARSQIDLLLETPLSADQKVSYQDECALVTATLPITPDLKRWVLGFGSGVQVLKPDFLRRDIMQTIDDMHKGYA